MKPTDPPPPKASAGQVPPPPNASAGQVPPPLKGTSRPGLHGGYPLRDSGSADPYDDGVEHHHGDDDPLHNAGVEHEHRDVNLRAITMSAVSLLTVIVVSLVLMWGLFGYFEREAAANDPVVGPVARPATEMPATTASPYFSSGVTGPQLVTNEPMVLMKQRAEEARRLQAYGWVDEKTGIAHMPIDEAKKLIVQRGRPVREDGGVGPALGTRLPAAGEASGGRVITVPLPEPTAGAPAPPATAKPHGGH
jgi:hypothetical protein